MTTRRATFLIGLLLAAAAAAGTAAVAAQKQDQPEQTYDFDRSDPVMNAAKRRGIETLPSFYARLASPGPDEDNFMVKFDILPGEPVEYVWAGQLDRSTRPMTGVLTNQPRQGPHRMGERVPIREADIIDWIYRRGRVFQGGFTERVVIDRMPPEEARRQRESLGW